MPSRKNYTIGTGRWGFMPGSRTGGIPTEKLGRVTPPSIANLDTYVKCLIDMYRDGQLEEAFDYLHCLRINDLITEAQANRFLDCMPL
jgi:hypothetical protein